MPAAKKKAKRKAKKKAKTKKKEKPAPKQAPKPEAVVIRDRIKEFRRVKASELVPDPDNWRTHPRSQKLAVSGILSEIGYADALLARETPAGLMLIDGHLRRELTPDQEVPVLVLDLTEAEAHTMLVLLDPLAAMAGTDKVGLASLLEEVQVDSAALDTMLGKMADKAGIAREDGEEGESLEGDSAGQHNVLIVCNDEAHQLELIERFLEEGLQCRGLIS